MNLWIVVPVLVALLALRVFRPTMLVWAGSWWVASWLIIDHGFAVPVPQSAVKLFMGIVTLALFAYVTSDPERLEQVRRPLTAFLTERRHTPLLALVAVAIPAAVAAGIYFDLTAPPQAPSFGRTIHPAPPATIQVHGEEKVLDQLDNPYREMESLDPAAFRQRVEDGRRVYYQNCYFCHGDLMQGDGMYAHALNPIPTNFQDPGTIAMFRESFLFWRIAKGAPGLPEEGGPWMSAMPAWEDFLTEEEIWNAILFLYDFTEQRPRAREVGHE